jgi:SAM-dependent methyltransferase
LVLLLAHGSLPPSPWITRFASLIRPGGTVLDLACGSGRHVRWLVSQGFVVTAVDRDEAAVAPLRALAEVIVTDLEGGPWPLAGRRFDAVVVANYLWRPLLPLISASLAEGGVLIYETFALGQQLVGRPSRPEFLLHPGELLRAAAGLRIVAFEDGFEPARGERGARFVQRIAAVREMPDPTTPPRHVLSGANGAGGPAG